LVNGNYYFGVHKTKNPYDDYLGSGTYIKLAIKKYGAENFRKDILFIYPDSESAFSKEDELVQCYRGTDPSCRNIRQGGSGGFDYINENLPHGTQKLNDKKVVEIRRLAVEEGKFAKELGEQFNVSPRTVLAILRGTARSWKHVTGGLPVVQAHRAPKRGKYTEKHREKMSKARRQYFNGNADARAATGKRLGGYWKGKQKSAEHCKRLGDANRRRKNPILGKVWVNDCVGLNKLVLPEEALLLIKQGWKRGMLCKTA
jgi:hypothetical protein